MHNHVRWEFLTDPHTLVQTYYLVGTLSYATFEFKLCNSQRDWGQFFNSYKKVTKPMTMIIHTHDQYGILFDPC